MEWNPSNEKLIRDIGDFIDKQVRDILDPNVSTPATITRLFNARSTGEALFNRATKELGLDFKGDIEGAAKTIIETCEKNGSDAAAKIKKAVPVAKQLADEFGLGPDSKVSKWKAPILLAKVKKKGIKYD
jgi:hypothetical protein